MGNLQNPGYIDITEDGNIIVPDGNSNCVNIFSSDGSVKQRFGIRGRQKGQLRDPYGVATDGEYILVCETFIGRIQVFDMDGTFVYMIESGGDHLSLPHGLAVSNDGHVYVADTSHHCIKKV